MDQERSSRDLCHRVFCLCFPLRVLQDLALHLVLESISVYSFIHFLFVSTILSISLILCNPGKQVYNDCSLLNTNLVVFRCHMCVHACMHVCLVAQSHLSLCNPLDCSLPVYSFFGIYQARIFERVAISSTQGLNPWLLWFLHWQVGSLPLNHPGSLRFHILLNKIRPT